MKRPRIVIYPLLLLLAAGCASPQADPSVPKAGRGYADFYPDPPRAIFWKVEEWDASKKDFGALLSQFKAPPNGVLRLETDPGTHRYRLSVQNMASEGPVEVEANIVAEKITPIRVRFETGQDTYVRSVEDKVRHGGRRRDVTDYEQEMYRLSAAAEPVQAYQPREKMSYAQTTVPNASSQAK